MNRIIYILIFHLTITIHADELNQVLDKLLSTHPEILSLNADLNSKRANANHETTYPDPKIGVAFRNYPTRSYSISDRPYDTPGMTGIEYSISQEIPYPGRLTLQGKVSRLNEMEYSHFSKSRKNQFILEYLSQIIRLKSSDKKLIYNNLIRKILESQKKISASTFATGNSALSKTLKLQIEGTMSQEREIELHRDRKYSLASLEYFKTESTNLAKLIDVEPSNFLTEKFDFIQSQKLKLKENIVENPNYKLASVAVERAKNESKLSNILHSPDTEIFFSYMKRRNRNITFDTGPLNYQPMDVSEYRGDLFSFGVNVRVPVWSFFSSEDLKNRSSENTKSKSFELEKNKVFLESSYEKLVVTLDSLESQIELYEKRLIPELTKSYSALSSQYASGKIDLIEVLSANIELNKAHISKEELLEKQAITTLLILELTDNFIKQEAN